MAKAAYVGIDEVARRIKKFYIGVPTDIPIYETVTTTNTYDFTYANRTQFFSDNASTATTGWTISSYSSGGVKLVPNNFGVNNSIAPITLTALKNLTNVTIKGIYYTESGYDKITLVAGGTTVLNAVSGTSSTLTTHYTGNLTAGQTISFTYAKDNSRDATNEASTYFVVDCNDLTITTEIKEIIGYETKGIAHKVKKGYVGVDGVAKLFYPTEKKLVYYGTAPALSAARQNLAATTIGNYALFGGGGLSDSAVVDAYNTSLTRSIPTALNTARENLAATTVGNYALFGGGQGLYYYSTMDAYNTSLTHSTPTALSIARDRLAATNVGDYALFGGGSDPNNKLSAIVDSYNASLTRTTPTALSAAKRYLAAITVGDYALFGGGTTDNYFAYSAAVNAYNTSLTRSTPTALSTARQYLATTNVGDYALFGGGYGDSLSAVVDSYNASLTRTTPTALSTARRSLAATNVGDYALFGGGYESGTLSVVVDAYNASLTRSIPTALNTARQYLAATTVGNYALFGGGRTTNTSSNLYTSVVEVYTVAE